jgi:alpha-tubulin suppressor-like RCC1 family protein
VQVGNDNDWVATAAGQWESYALKANGTLWAWGYNYEGELGLGDTLQRLAPVQVGIDSDWVTLSAGRSHALALKANGSAWVWGNNHTYALGLGDTDQRHIPTLLNNDHDWMTLQGGGYFSHALKANGTAWGWGNNLLGTVGNGNTTHVHYPVQVGNFYDCVAITTGYDANFALRSAGRLWVWGSPNSGSLALGYYSAIPVPSPVQVFGDNDWVDVAIGEYHTLAIKAAGSSWVTGGNDYGQLGTGNFVWDSAFVNRDPGLSEWVSASTGGSHSLALRSDGSLWAWGGNSDGQLGFGNLNEYDQYSPQQVGNGHNWIAMAAGGDHNLALQANGRMYSWGRNSYGQLGNGNTNSYDTPQQVGGDSTWADICAGSAHSLALKANGSLWAWGRNGNGQLGTGNTTDIYTPYHIGNATDWMAIATGDSFSLALKANGTLWAWGRNDHGQLGQGNNTEQHSPQQVGSDSVWTQVAAGGSHVLALKANGTLWAWGYNGHGQLGDGSTNDKLGPQQIGNSHNWIAVSAGRDHSYALAADGKVWSWGANDKGQLGQGNYTELHSPAVVSGQTGVIQLFEGSQGEHAAIIKDNRSYVCLTGYNMHGQLGDQDTARANTFGCISICGGPVMPTLSISVSPGDTICPGLADTFTATSTWAGTPLYYWYKNGQPVATTLGNKYVDSTLVDGDTITCLVGATGICAQPSMVLSNAIVLSIPLTGLAGTVGNTETKNVFVNGPVDVRYSDCDLMATLIPWGDSPLYGSTDVKVTIDNSLQSYNGQSYLERHFDIEPALIPATATATVRLYAYQSEFDAYNTWAATAGLPPLPSGGIDNGNVRISQFHGTGTQPGNYSGSELLITPAVSWDAVNNWWVMEFPVIGFSGFYIHTATGAFPLGLSSVPAAGQQGITVYPNPVTDILQVDYSNITGGQIEICDMAGRVLICQPLSHSLNMKGLASGAYMLKIKTAKQATFVKMLLKH